ncbi:MAG TPA: glycosyltransferase family 39 protein [Polyangiaceae bacterium]|nr:glycosyltransferase family 39 protein [Polyangiaceae bacterium]
MRESPSWKRWAPLATAAAVPALLFLVLPPLTRSGLWDPYELGTAELARRLAVNLLHAPGLALPGADDSMPHLNDLGRPELPFTSIALGFRVFGLHEWAGRLPLALWGIVGVLATYAFVARLFDRRTGVYAAIALSTMPLYFVQARTMLGDVCTMAGLAMSFGGLAVAAFDRDEEGPTGTRARLPWVAMAAVGLFVGLESRGALIGVAVPALGVGLTWAVTRLGTKGARDRRGDVVGAVSLLLGVSIAVVAARIVAAPGQSKDLSLWVGAVLHTPPRYPTFDVYVASVGHALVPWSAFLPFAFGRLLLAPRGGSAGTAERESLARVALFVGATVVVVAQGFLAARTDLVAFAGPALCAAACAVAIRDLERGAHASIAIGLATLLVAAILHHDMHELPDKAFQAFGITGATFPTSFEDRSLTLWWIALGGFALCALFTWIERDPEREPFDPMTYRTILQALKEAYDGMLALVYFAAVAGAGIAALVVLVGARTHAHWMPQMSANVRDIVLNAWWVIAFVPPGALFGLVALADVWLWAFGGKGALSRLSLTRASSIALGGAVAGFVLCFFYYPALANQLSPKEVFESYRSACPGAPLGLLGVGGRTAAYYAGGQQTSLGDAKSAYDWMTAGGSGERRCLAMKSDELPKLEQLWRQNGHPGTNVPILDARSSQILLAASSLAPGQSNENPFSSFLLESEPQPQRPLDVNLDDKLHVIGTDLVDDRNRRMEGVIPGRTYHLRVYYRVTAPVGMEWPNAFLHVDGSGRRHGGDHKPLGGRYPMTLWLPGDVIADDYELKLEPNFTPGNYTVYFGLANGDKCTDRLAVKSGPSDGCNRVNAGPLRVL